MCDDSSCDFGGGVCEMGRIAITLAGGRYDRTRALVDGSIQPDGIDLNYIELPIEEIFWRELRYGEFDAAECSLGYYLITKAQGLNRYVAIPVFPSRCFRHGFVFVNKRSGIQSPEDLRGKTVGVPEYAMTAAIWLRGLFEHDYGVRPRDMRWVTGGVEEPGRTDRMSVDVQDHVLISDAPPGRTLGQMLETGEIDALIGPRIPSCFTKNPDISRLFVNYKEIERAYYERTRIVPLMHTVVMKRSLYERYPWIAQSLYKAYRESMRRCYAVMRDVNALPYCLPWYLPALEETLEVFGDDFWPEGIEANWSALSLLMQYSREQGLIDRAYSPEELFAPTTLTEFRI